MFIVNSTIAVRLDSTLNKLLLKMWAIFARGKIVINDVIDLAQPEPAQANTIQASTEHDRVIGCRRKKGIFYKYVLDFICKMAGGLLAVFLTRTANYELHSNMWFFMIVVCFVLLPLLTAPQNWQPLNQVNKQCTVVGNEECVAVASQKPTDCSKVMQ